MTTSETVVIRTNTDSKGFSFGTKAETLHRLTGHIKSALFCPQISFSVLDWSRNQASILNAIEKEFLNALVAVRSSSISEDLADKSNAGAFLSLINVPAKKTSVEEAINSVIESYKSPFPFNQILVQPMVKNVVISGVMSTRNLDTGSPYYVINYDDKSGKTDIVTGGGESKSIMILHGKENSLKSGRFKELIIAFKEIQVFSNEENLDIEFCINTDNDIYILQVRPLATVKNWDTIGENFFLATESIKNKIISFSSPPTGVVGDYTIFGEMPDWNPAEIIGRTPRPLALSLYKNLITNETWHLARAYMGYKTVPYPLMVDFCGRPYIDVRLSLNSFLPKAMDDQIAERFINFQLKRLRNNRHLHDKMEFEIAVTCLDFSFHEKMKSFIEEGLTEAEAKQIYDELHRLTTKFLKSGTEEINFLMSKTRDLLDICNTVSNSKNSLNTINNLLKKCKLLGTFNFAILARHAFIATSLLKSLKIKRILTDHDIEAFMSSIETVASGFVHDTNLLFNEEIEKEKFLKKYGHLRPGTYDILSPRYDENLEGFLGKKENQVSEPKKKFEINKDQETQISTCLRQFNFEMTHKDLFSYIQSSIIAREESKFIFTKVLSDALRLLKEWGENLGLTQEDLSFLTYEEICTGQSVDEMRTMIKKGQENYRLTQLIHLPHLIDGVEDVDIVRLPLGHPTFITNKTVSGTSILLDMGAIKDLAGKIVLIENADPGFDWIFSHDIKGLITMYGGANSHMAIRCSEFGLPAAIGCGERLFKKVSSASYVILNCAIHAIQIGGESIKW